MGRYGCAKYFGLCKHVIAHAHAWLTDQTFSTEIYDFPECQHCSITGYARWSGFIYRTSNDHFLQFRSYWDQVPARHAQNRRLECLDRGF